MIKNSHGARTFAHTAAELRHNFGPIYEPQGSCRRSFTLREYTAFDRPPQLQPDLRASRLV